MTKIVKEIYQQFPTHADCIAYLEKLRWDNTPLCPYCGTVKITPMPKEERYHCNDCKASFSVTVDTIFHRARCDLQVWFAAIQMISRNLPLSAREMGSILGVTKDTALSMRLRIKKSINEQDELVKSIINNLK